MSFQLLKSKLTIPETKDINKEYQAKNNGLYYDTINLYLKELININTHSEFIDKMVMFLEEIYSKSNENDSKILKKRFSKNFLIKKALNSKLKKINILKNEISTTELNLQNYNNIIANIKENIIKENKKYINNNMNTCNNWSNNRNNDIF